MTQTPFPIDAVLPWVDGKDPALAAKRAPYAGGGVLENNEVGGPARYVSLGEIRWTVASMLRYAPFLRNEYKKGLKIVDDAESAVGKAMRTDVETSHYFLLPFVMGIYDLDAEKELHKMTFEKPLGKGYNWYKFGKAVNLPKNGYLYMTRGWSAQLNSAPPEFSGKDFDDIWVSVKFTGPKFFADEQGKDYIYIDRVVLVVPDK